MTNSVAEVERKIRAIMDRSITASAPKPVQFRHKRTGELATQISLMDMGNWQRVGSGKPKPRKPSKDAPFSAHVQYQVDLQNWRQSH